MHCGHSLNSLNRKAAHEWITLLGYSALRKSPLGLAVFVTYVHRLISPLCRQNSSETKVLTFARHRLMSPIIRKESFFTGAIAFFSHVQVREKQQLREDLVKDYKSGIGVHLPILSVHIQVHCRWHTRGFWTAYQSTHSTNDAEAKLLKYQDYQPCMSYSNDPGSGKDCPWDKLSSRIDTRWELGLLWGSPKSEYECWLA
jgi:hypothetical protein